MKRWEGKVAVITGASAGIGAAIAEQLVEHGLQVIGLARREEKVRELAAKLKNKKGKLHAHKADISIPEEVIAAFEWIKQEFKTVDILVNNAGVIKNTTLIDGDIEKWKQVLDTNVLGLCVATREAVSLMKANNIDGHIVHINSIAGHKPMGPNVYAGSKFAVTALTETLRNELNDIGSKIKISSVSPGFVTTEIFEANGYGDMDLSNQAALQSEDIADGVIYVLSTPPHVQADVARFNKLISKMSNIGFYDVARLRRKRDELADYPDIVRKLNLLRLFSKR